MKALIAMGVELQPKAADGASPLHLAADSGQVETVAVLVQLGADVNSVREATPTHQGSWEACCGFRPGLCQCRFRVGLYWPV